MKSRFSKFARPSSSTDLSFADQVMLKKQKPCGELSWVQGTSNQVERLPSLAKLILGSLRHRMTPLHLEMMLFLRVNKKFRGQKH